MLKINIRLSKFFIKFHFIIIITIISLLLIAETVFLYRFFYEPLTETKIIGALRQQTALQPIRVDLFEALKLTKYKKQHPQAIDWNIVRDPFKKLQTAPRR